MRLRVEDLTRFWAAACEPRPLMIVGAGRWGRTLSEVAAQARGDASHLALVARHNLEDTRTWRDADARRTRLEIARDIPSALEALSAGTQQQPLAIVASRPVDHVRDARACLERGLDTLVEKPLTANPADADELARAAAVAKRLLALGVEFSLMPAFHYAVTRYAAPVKKARLQWSDPPGELRHGQRKRAHEELHAVEDNLTHAISIFRIFAPPNARFAVTTADMPGSRDGGTVVFASDDATWEFVVDRAAAVRRRHLEVETTNGHLIAVDFSEPEGVVWFDGQRSELPRPWAGLSSTLRLEIGAFFTQTTARTSASPLTHDVLEYARLHEAVLHVCRPGR